MQITREQLLSEYEDYARPREQWLVGGEFERHLLWPDGRPVSYSEPHGVRWLLDRMAERGWSPTYEGEFPIALQRGAAWITLEPGGQLELSGAPHQHVGDLVREALHFAHELQEAIGDVPIRQVALGYTPFARIEDIEWVPKGRYVVMREILGKAGDLAHHMMKGTASVQASYDFSSEADCAEKMRLGIQLGPLTTAMFANSPLTQGKPNGWMSFRGHIWTRTDPARTGFPDAALNFTYERWVDYLLDVPMMFTKIGGQWANAGGISFRQWMEHGIGGIWPTHTDWDLHLTSVFPEIRAKRTLEVRGADCVPIALAGSFAAMYKGLFYCDRGKGLAQELAERFAAAGTQAERFETGCRQGLAGEIGGRRLASWAEDLLEIAVLGISHCDPEDVPLLQPLIDQIATGHSPARDVLADFAVDPRPETLMEQLTCHV